MSDYTAILTDLDGTAIALGSDGSDITQTTRSAVQAAQKLGCKVACATGRRWEIVEPIVQSLGIQHLCVIEGGTRIIDPLTEKTVWEKHLDVNALDATLDIFKREASDAILVTAKLPKTNIHEVTSVHKHSQFMYLLGLHPEEAKLIANTINAQGFAVAHLTISWSGGGRLDVHVTHPEATKGQAIKVWQEMEGVSQAQTIGMGDSGNDIPLFEAVGLKVAVGDGTPELKALADYIAPDQKDEPLAHVINHFLLHP